MFQQHADQDDGEPVDERYMDLIEKVLRGADQHRRRGIDQGDPYSPFALLVLLHTSLDVPLAEGVNNSLWVREPVAQCRYADNLATPARSVPEGHRVLRRNASLLRIRSLELKGTGGVYDLTAGEHAQLLGFTLRQDNNRLNLDLGNEALVRLEEHLIEAHNNPNPVVIARNALRGWIDAYGPAFVTGRACLPGILKTAAACGFRELDSMPELTMRWAMSHKRWRKTLRAARRSDGI